MSSAKKHCTMQSAVGSVTLDMHMQRNTCKPWMNGFAGASACVYGRVGNVSELVSAI